MFNFSSFTDVQRLQKKLFHQEKILSASFILDIGNLHKKTGY